MNGYLMQEQRFVRGKDTFIESFAQENKHGVVFEDDGETGYFYAVERDGEGRGMRVLDALHIYEVDSETGQESKLQILWSRDWEKSALVIDGYCHAIYDFKAQGGYNINEFPPPNEIWTQGERKLTDEMIRSLF
jgi:hypothetical protein